MTIHLRQDRAVFRISGTDAAKLLHDTVTGHVAAGMEGGGWWALLTPQGKIVAEGLIGWADGAFWLDVHRDSAEQFFKMMRLYKMRANAVIEDLTETHSVGWSPKEVEGAIVHTDPRGGGMGWRVIADARDTADWEKERAAYDRTRVSKGVIEVGADFAPSSLFAHDIGMDFNGGIDFKKGCYIGQEVVSRMKHRGTARRRPVVVSDVDGAQNGDTVLAGERSAGELGTVVEGRSVAILRLDRIEDPAAATVNGRPVTLALPEWASYRFGDSAPE